MKLRSGIIGILALLMALCMVFTGCVKAEPSYTESIDTKQTQESVTDTDKKVESDNNKVDETTETEGEKEDHLFTLEDVKPYSGNPYVIVNGNQPNFAKSEITTKSYEFYSPLDSLGRCGYAMACLSKDTMPASDEERGDISKVKPTGWINNRYDSSVVPGGYLYNRSHLIGWQLSAENANKQNLITGTRDLNQLGMLPFENMVADYIKETGNHVMYRITPMFDGDNLVASGVHMEAYSVEDNGEGICFNVFVYNIQPGITIDYATGENRLTNPPVEDDDNTDNNGTNDGGNSGNTDNSGDTGNGDAGGGSTQSTYILNINSKKIHYPDCSSVAKMSEQNKQEYSGALSDLPEGYTACGICNPK